MRPMTFSHPDHRSPANKPIKHKLGAITLGILLATPFQAALTHAEMTLEEIVVTARKRIESAQDTPVVLTAFNKDMLEANAISNVEDLAAIIPNLNISESGSGVTPLITLRGIGSSSALLNGATDQAVSINIDGVQFSNGMALRLGQLDVEQVEVLKGPQALYFGKNSPAGIIVIKTASPTDELFSEFRLGYEDAGETLFGHAIVSGPLSDSVAARLAISYTDTEGYWNNNYPGVKDNRSTFYDEVIARGTLNWAPSDVFEMTSKLTWSQRDGGTVTTWQLAACDDSPLLGRAAYSDCELNDSFSIADPSQAPLFSQDLGVIGLYDSAPSHEFNTLIGSVEFSWQLSDDWQLDGVTGYFDFENQRFDNYYHSSVLTYGQRQENESISQELRLSADFDKLSLMFGVFADERKYTTTAEYYVERFATIPNFLAPSTVNIDSDSWSVFGQLAYALTDTLELSLGGRYTDESRRYQGQWLGNGVALKGSVAGENFRVKNPKTSYDNFSPEATLSYRPNDNALLFASYREGFKAGGYDTGATTAGNSFLPAYLLTPGQNDFNEELVEGFELGAKTEWLENRLRLNGTVFYYQYSDLQITSIDIVDSVSTTRTLNAGELTSQGAELEATYLPSSVDGLLLTASVNYLDVVWDDAIIPCSDWQEKVDASGCNIDTGGNGSFDQTQLAGSTKSWSPKYGLSLGAVYDISLGNGLGMRFHALGVWTDEQDGLGYGDYEPRAMIDDYWMLNASVSLYSEDNAWSIDLIAKNLSDEATPTVFGPSAGSQLPLEPLQAARSAPRQLSVQFTVRPGNW